LDGPGRQRGLHILAGEQAGEFAEQRLRTGVRGSHFFEAAASDTQDDGFEQLGGVRRRVAVGEAGDEGPEVHREVLVGVERAQEPVERAGLAQWEGVLDANGFDFADRDCGLDRQTGAESRDGVRRHRWK
jgi:hypothetical protein